MIRMHESRMPQFPSTENPTAHEIPAIFRFRGDCLAAMREEVSAAGPGGIAVENLFIAISDRVSPVYGAGAYQWKALEYDADYFYCRNMMDIDDGYFIWHGDRFRHR